MRKQKRPREVFATTICVDKTAGQTRSDCEHVQYPQNHSNNPESAQSGWTTVKTKGQGTESCKMRTLSGTAGS
jgi:hypothetical protein